VDYDVIVVGGGPVGAGLARAAGGVSVALLAAARRIPKPAPEGAFDSRVYALSPGNVSFLRAIGAWQALEPESVAPVSVTVLPLATFLSLKSAVPPL